MLERRRLRNGLIALFNSLEGGCSQVGISLFCRATSHRTRGYCLKLGQGMVKLDIEKNFFLVMEMRRGNGLSRKGVESPSLKVLQETLDIALGAKVQLRGGGRSQVGLDEFRGLFPPN